MQSVPGVQQMLMGTSFKRTCPAGTAVFTLKAGHTLEGLLVSLLEQERSRAAA